MTEPKETFSRPLVISWRFLWAVVTGWGALTLSVVGLAIGGAGWKHDTEAALVAIKADIVTIRADQAASRQRGDVIRLTRWLDWAFALQKSSLGAAA